jgi:hypothetical protein
VPLAPLISVSACAVGFLLPLWPFFPAVVQLTAARHAWPIDSTVGTSV